MSSVPTPNVVNGLLGTNQITEAPVNPENVTASIELASPHDGYFLYHIFLVYRIVLAIAFVTFLLVRQIFPRLYTIQNGLTEIKTYLADSQHGFIFWIWKFFSLKDDKIMKECGMDTFCFLCILTMDSKFL